MAVIATRLQSDGILLLNGEFDEYTYAGNIAFESSTTNAAVFVSGVFDEVTYNLTSPLINNILQYSQAINVTNWANSNNTVTGNAAAAPDNSVTASRIQVDPNGYTALLNRPVTNGADYVFSFFVKSYSGSSGTWGVNWYSETDGHHRTTVPITGEWTRQYITFTANRALINVYVADNRSSLATITDAYVWGAQLELGTTPSIYQPIAATGVVLDTNLGTRVDSSGNQYVSNIFDEFTGAPVVDSNLVLWLDAAQITSYPGSGTTWTDLSGTNNNGSLVSSPTFDSVTGGGSLGFNGTSYVSLAANLVPSGSRSITMAFQSSNNSTRMGLISNRDSGGWFCCVNRNGNSNINYAHASSGGVEEVQALNVITDLNTWYITTIIYNVVTGNASIYLNQNLIAGPTTISPIVPPGANTSFVAREINSTSTLLGRVGDVLVYNRALTADEVEQNFNALRRRYGL